LEQVAQALHAKEHGRQIPGIVLGRDLRRRLFRSVPFPLVCIIHRKPVWLVPQT
jgi:hypothetical protein